MHRAPSMNVGEGGSRRKKVGRTRDRGAHRVRARWQLYTSLRFTCLAARPIRMPLEIHRRTSSLLDCLPNTATLLRRYVKPLGLSNAEYWPAEHVLIVPSHQFAGTLGFPTSSRIHKLGTDCLYPRPPTLSHGFNYPATEPMEGRLSPETLPVFYCPNPIGNDTRPVGIHQNPDFADSLVRIASGSLHLRGVSDRNVGATNYPTALSILRRQEDPVVLILHSLHRAEDVFYCQLSTTIFPCAVSMFQQGLTWTHATTAISGCRFSSLGVFPRLLCSNILGCSRSGFCMRKGGLRRPSYSRSF